MLKSLEKLRNGTYFPEGEHRTTDNEYGEKLADEIQAEIDRFYLPRPLFEDGEPADFEMEFVTGKGFAEKIEHIDFYPECVEINLRGDYTDWTYREDRPLKHPSEPDTQEQIDADARLDLLGYCAKHHLTYVDDKTTSIAVRVHLLDRQRKPDGVE